MTATKALFSATPRASHPTLAACVCAALTLSACSGLSGQPAGPSDGDLDSILGESSGDKPPPGGNGPDGEPGRVTLHRLNRVEYNNTVRDLMGTTLRPADVFPSDDRGYGYDNIADVLSLSPLQIELYYNAAQSLVSEALAKAAASVRHELEAETIGSDVGHAAGTAWVLDSPGRVEQAIDIAEAGEYRVTVRVWGEQAGDELAEMALELNGSAIETVSVEGTAASPTTFETTLTLSAESQRFGVSFTNDFYDANAGLDRNLVVDSLTIEGPLGADGSISAQRASIMVCEPDPTAPLDCLRTVVQKFGRRAFRRSLASEEVQKLLAIAEARLADGDELETATQTMLAAVLVSPHFVFRVELDDGDGQPRVLSDHELASRLSYFLWSSMPDETLLALADAGTLHEASTLKAQVTRMLSDDKAEALVENFAGQWLFTRAVHDHQPDVDFYPEFDEALRDSAQRETENFFRTFLFGEERMDNLLSAGFSFVDGRLSEHYGIAAPAGPGFGEVTLPDNRVGLLTQASVLMVTSFPTRTSPVKRGKWVLEQLLCTPPPPPPADIPELDETEASTPQTVREKLEEHRKNPTCASCHQLMDPLGFGLERYDGIGTFRETENGIAVDDTGELIDGTEFQGARELSGLIEADPRYPKCITEHLLTYALGRGLKTHDRADVSELTTAFVEGGFHLRTLIENIVLSDPFRMRGVEAEEKKP